MSLRLCQRLFLNRWTAFIYGKEIILFSVLPCLTKKKRSQSEHEDNGTLLKTIS